MNHSTEEGIYQGLKALAESSFPKKCNNCGRKYASVEEFIADTQLTNGHRSGLKSSIDETGANIVELYRNCPCGSTLMDAFNDRRDLSEAGDRRRQNFEKLLKVVEKAHHIERQVAREELRKILRGEGSDIIKNILG